MNLRKLWESSWVSSRLELRFPALSQSSRLELRFPANCRLRGKPLGLPLVGLISSGFNQIPMTLQPKVKNSQGTPKKPSAAIWQGRVFEAPHPPSPLSRSNLFQNIQNSRSILDQFQINSRSISRSISRSNLFQNIQNSRSSRSILDQFQINSRSSWKLEVGS